MKTIGLIGGMSWESTITYYEVLNKIYEDDWFDWRHELGKYNHVL